MEVTSETKSSEEIRRMELREKLLLLILKNEGRRRAEAQAQACALAAGR